MIGGVGVQFYLIDIDSDSSGNIKLYGRTLDGKRICVIDRNFKQYFWVIPKEDINELKKELENIEIKNNERIIKIKTEIHKKIYQNEEVEAFKIILEQPGDLKLVKDEIKNFYVEIKEIDIPFIKRYLIDREITPLGLCEVKGDFIIDKNFEVCIEGEVNQVNQDIFDRPRIIAIDIECYGDIITDKVKKDPIISVGFYDNNGFKKVVTWKRFKAPEYVEIVDSEERLIERIGEIIRERKPDYLVGYNSDDFDLPYIKGRADKYKIRLDWGIDRSPLKFKRGRTTSAKISGVIHLDIFRFIRRIMSGSLQLDSYNLNTVSNEVLGEGKYDINHALVEDMWNRGDIKDICEYNLQDVRLTLSLCERILPNLNELVKLVGMPLFNICRMSYGQLVENYLLKRSKEFNIIVPDKPLYDIADRIEETYQGAFVMEPKPGLYENVVVFDFMSLYPTIIISKNIDPSMLNYSEGYETPEMMDDGRKVKYFFSSKKEGFIPSIVKDLITRRNRIKEILKEEDNPILRARSYALKTVANATYGYFGFFGSRWYSKECAASITAFARDYISEVIKKAGEEFKVIYSDTDSIAFTLGNKSEEDALRFLKRMNNELPSLMELELEGIYPRGIFVSKKSESKGAKKKYALIDKKGEIKIRGFETIRRDWSLIARETQENILNLILKTGDSGEALEYAQKVIENIQFKNIELKKMIMSTQLRMNLDAYKQIGPHVAVAKSMMNKGVLVGPGTSINFIIVEGNGMIRDRAKLPSECREKEYDSNYYIDNQVVPSVEKIFEIFGISREELISKEQSKLGDFNE